MISRWLRVYGWRYVTRDGQWCVQNCGYRYWSVIENDGDGPYWEERNLGAIYFDTQTSAKAYVESEYAKTNS